MLCPLNSIVSSNGNLPFGKSSIRSQLGNNINAFSCTAIKQELIWNNLKLFLCFIFLLGMDIHIFFSYSSQIQNAPSKYNHIPSIHLFSFRHPRAWDRPCLDFIAILLYLLYGSYWQCHNLDSCMDRKNPLEFNVLLSCHSIILSCLSTSVPRMLGIFWFNAHEIGFGTCVARSFSYTPSQEWNLMFCWLWPLTAM